MTYCEKTFEILTRTYSINPIIVAMDMPFEGSHWNNVPHRPYVYNPSATALVFYPPATVYPHILEIVTRERS